MLLFGRRRPVPKVRTNFREVGESQVQFGQVSPEMGRTENRKMPDFKNQPSRGLSGVLGGDAFHCHSRTFFYSVRGERI